ncbi:MAG: hypothetical protein NC833_01370 [Candidatus Omnitrophica bacterium]|nr:hypothetical protein [Candidatus Omnitrophota bacterium]
MERKSRKIIERNKKIIFIFLFLNFISFSQNINLIEEIEGKNLAERKTIIFDIRPSFPEEISFPELPKIEIKELVEETSISKIKKNEIKQEKIKNLHLSFGFGSFDTRIFNIDYQSKKINFGISNFYTENYRENSEIENFIFYSSIFEKNYKFNFNISFGKNELPGPLTNPFDIERDFCNLNLAFSHYFDNLILRFSDKNYLIEDDKIHFLNFNIEIPFKNTKFLTDLEEEIFESEFNIFSIAQYIIFENERFKISCGLKFIEDDGLRFLPQFLYKINNNLSFFLNSNYRNPDLWKDVIMENWKEIKKEKLKPEESYKIGLRFNIKENSLEISHSYNKKYLWEDIDNNFLYEPFRDEFWETSFDLDSKISFTDNLSLFLKLEKNIFDNKIFYLPEENLEYGILYKNKNLISKIFSTYKGERIFKTKEIKGYSTLNFEISYKDKFEVGFGLYNILNTKYEIAPDYLGEKKKFIFWLKF